MALVWYLIVGFNQKSLIAFESQKPMAKIGKVSSLHWSHLNAALHKAHKFTSKLLYRCAQCETQGGNKS